LTFSRRSSTTTTMQIEPLPKKIHDKALSLGVTEIHLNFSGGNDEGYLSVSLEGTSDSNFTLEVENWAWEAYSYNGAGDGSDYGDDIVYDLVNNKVSTEEWYMMRTRGQSYENNLEVEK
jgi:hypothetical protein